MNNSLISEDPIQSESEIPDSQMVLNKADEVIMKGEEENSKRDS